MLRGRERVAVGSQKREDVTDQSIGYTGCGGSAVRPETLCRCLGLMRETTYTFPCAKRVGPYSLQARRG